MAVDAHGILLFSVTVCSKGGRAMYRILIADDETIIREGIKYLFDYSELGYTICGEAATGDETFAMIRDHRPDVVLLDIKMPGMTGLEVIRKAREAGFDGKVVIVSSYTDFKYAQEAIRYGVQDYITKPIDDDELREILTRFRESFDREGIARTASQQYRSKARSAIVRDIILGEGTPSAQSWKDLHLDAACYQVAIFSRPYTSTAGEVHLANPDHSLYDHIFLQNQDVLLLKGEGAIKKLREMIEFNANANRNTPERIPFFACGAVVTSFDAIPDSYRSAQTLMQRRFFCERETYLLEQKDLPESDASMSIAGSECVKQYATQLLDCIQSFNRRRMMQTLKELQERLYRAPESVESIKLFLTDLYLQVKEQMRHLYSGSEIPFFSNAAIIRTIRESSYLSEIIWFYSKRFEVFMDATGISTRDSVLDDILHYIHHNYASNITLENIAPLFGYNRSYLGKIFTKKMGQNFNSYVDFVRIEKSKELLLKDDMKVYTIAERVGYKNVDYFHIKFRKYVGQSPAEFRKKNKVAASDHDTHEENE